MEDTIAILRGLKERYEVHHGVEITDPAIVAAATLSHRYIADRQLPDKAIDLIDEAGSLIRMEIDSKPEALDKLDRRIIQLKIEREALKKEADEASRKRLSTLEDALKALEKEYSDLEEVWKAEKATVQGAAHIKEELERARQDHGYRPPRAGSGAHVRTAVRAHPGARAETGQGARSGAEAQSAAAQFGDRSGDRRDRVEVDRHSGVAHARRRARQAAAHGRSVGQARRRPAGGRQGSGGCDSPFARGAVRSAPAERLIHVLGTHRRRENRAVQGTGGVHVRHRGGAWCASTCRSSWRSIRLRA